MLDDGLLERFPIDSLYGLHNMPGSPAGHLLTRRGPVMASEDGFSISVRGRGGHASALVVDPLVIAAEVATAHGATADVTYTHEFAPTVNDADCTARAVRAARTALGPSQVDGDCAPVLASEDFGVLADHVPACLLFLGNSTVAGQGGIPLHSHDDVFNDEVLAAGVAFCVQIVRDTLTA